MREKRPAKLTDSEIRTLVATMKALKLPEKRNQAGLYQKKISPFRLSTPTWGPWLNRKMETAGFIPIAKQTLE